MYVKKQVTAFAITCLLLINNDPQEVVVEVIGEDNVYSISDGSMTELDEALLDVATE